MQLVLPKAGRTDHVRGSHMDQCSRRVLWSAGSLPCCARGALAYTRMLSKPSPAPRRRNFEWRVFTPPKKIRLSSDCSGRRRKLGLDRDRARPEASPGSPKADVEQALCAAGSDCCIADCCPRGANHSQDAPSSMRCAALCLALLAAPAVAQDYSHVCATPANYQGSAMYACPTCSSVTCDAMMAHLTSSGQTLAGKDFSSAFSCSAETYMVKYTVNDIASYCCGTGDAASQRSACWVDHSYLCADPSSWTPSTVITHDDGTTSTCIQQMDWFTQAGAPLEGDDFSSASTAKESCTKSAAPGHDARAAYVHHVGVDYKCCSSGDSVCSDIVDSATLGGRVASAVGAVSVFAVLLGFH